MNQEYFYMADSVRQMTRMKGSFFLLYDCKIEPDNRLRHSSWAAVASWLMAPVISLQFEGRGGPRSYNGNFIWLDSHCLQACSNTNMVASFIHGDMQEILLSSWIWCLCCKRAFSL